MTVSIILIFCGQVFAELIRDPLSKTALATQCKDILQNETQSQVQKSAILDQSFNTQFVNEVRDHGVALSNYVDLFKSGEKVIYLTESHEDSAARLSIYDRMMDLKTAGVTHLALECFSQSNQKAIDFFLSNGGPIFLRQLREFLVQNWGYEPSYGKSAKTDYEYMLQDAIRATSNQSSAKHPKHQKSVPECLFDLCTFSTRISFLF